MAVRAAERKVLKGLCKGAVVHVMHADALQREVEGGRKGVREEAYGRKQHVHQVHFEVEPLHAVRNHRETAEVKRVEVVCCAGGSATLSCGAAEV